MKKVNYNKKEVLRGRHKRILSRVREGNSHIRLRFTKTNSHMYVQALDDINQRTIASSSTLSLKLPNGNRKNCEIMAKDLAEKLKKLNIERVVIDRGGHSYHGRISDVSEFLRKDGIKF